MPPLYDRQFFQQQAQGSYRSAQIVLPIVFERLRPASVIDIGCGLGPWLKVAAELGAQRILGIDGDYVDRAMLMVDQTLFLSRDLGCALDIAERFDLAISLEVAEHLPAGAAAGYIDSLTRLSGLVLFSAAIPAQGGTGHVNENWLEFWAIQFADRGFLPVDMVRPRIWNKRFVEPWYRQNIMIFADKEAITRHALRDLVVAPGELMSIVHPEVFMMLLGVNKVAPFGPQHLDHYYGLAGEAATRMRATGRMLASSG